MQAYRFQIGRRLIAAVALLGAACAGPPAIHPRSALLATESLGAAGGAGSAEFPRAHWWRVYADPALDALIERALKDNPTMRAAQARLDHALAAQEVAGAAAAPQIAASVDSTRQRFSENYIYPRPLGGSIQWLNGAITIISYMYIAFKI